MGEGTATSWGRYQASASVMMALLKMPAAWFQLSILFLSPSIHFRCAQSFNESLLWTASSADLVWDDSCSFTDEETGTQHSCHRWVYDRRDLTDTVNMMWDLVCDREMLSTWAQISLMCGVLSGNAIGGLLADRVGRKTVLVLFILLQPLMSAVVAVVPSFQLFVIFRYLLGFSLGGTMVISFVLGAELGAGPHRPAITILHQVPFGMGQTLLGFTAYFLTDWRDIQMALSIFCLIFLPYCWLIEESLQWLNQTGRLQRAERVMAAIRRRNSPGAPHASPTEILPMAEKQHAQVVRLEKINNNGSKAEIGFRDLFRSPRLCRYTLSIWTMWYCAGLSFFAMNAYQTQLGGNNAVNVGVGGLVGGIPGNILTIYLVKRFGRKNVSSIAHILVFVFAILIPVYDVGESPWDWQRRTLGLLTLVAMSVAYPALFLLSGELLPTVLRGSAMVVANLMARAGNATAPWVGPTAVFHRWLPMTIIAVAPLVSVFLMLFVPDTLGRPLPQTVDDVECNGMDRERRQENGTKSSEEGKPYSPVAGGDS